jgi:general secretion pathway protein A
VDDPARKRSLVDDPKFAAQLDDLDRGLVDQNVKSPARRRQRAPTDVAAAPRGQIAQFASRPRVADTPIVTDPGSRRPLLDLFPPVPQVSEPPPVPARRAAPAPKLARSSIRRAPAAKPRPADAPLTYETFYGLSDKPFAAAVDPRFLYHSTAHDAAAEQLLEAIRRRERVIVLTGEAGVGKTLLARVVVDQLDRRTVTSFVTDAFLTFDDLVKTVLADFGVLSREELSQRATGGGELMNTLGAFLASLGPLHADAVLVVDDAQNVPPSALRELHQLTAAAPQTLRIVLVGEPALLSTLGGSELRSLDELIASRIELGRLASDEVPGYVMHRLRVAGESPRIEFDDEALAAVFERSNGIPRTVNVLCDRAMTRAFDASASVVDAALVELAAADAGMTTAKTETRQLARVLLLVAAFGFLILAGAAAAGWVFQDRVEQTIRQWETWPPPPRTPRLAAPPELAPLPPPQSAILNPQSALSA